MIKKHYFCRIKNMLLSFVIGLGSSLHCIGMCGPIALSLPLKRSSNWQRASGALQYNLGRMLTYCLLGIIMGTIGLSANNIRWMQLLSIVVGLFMIGVAWRNLLHFTAITPSKMVGQLLSLIGTNISRLMRSQHGLKFLGLGILNGLLPCGMIYIALANALLQGSPLLGGFAMLLFGIGTTPALFSVAFFASKFSQNRQKQFARFVPYLMTIIGILVILRGLNLGIPYISPKISSTSHEHLLENNQKKQVEIICCTPD